MLGDEFDNSAVDLNRVRKLAGLPEAGFEPPHEVYEPQHSYSVADEGDLDFDTPLLDEPVMDAPVGMDAMDMAPMDMGMDAPVDAMADMGALAPTENATHWTATLDTLEQELQEIPVGDFKDIIDRLRRLANHAEDIRRSLVQEGRKTFRDYMREALAEEMTGDQMIGNNREEAVKAIHTRMGGKPTDLAKAQKAFSTLQGSGKIKQQGGKFSMAACDDETFNSMLADKQI